MKKIFSLSLVAGLTLVAVSLASVSIVNAQAGMVSSIFNRMTRGQQSLKTLRANIVMEKYNSKIVEKNDDATTVRLMNIEKNQKIPLDQFKLNLDSNVKRVKG